MFLAEVSIDRAINVRSLALRAHGTVSRQIVDLVSLHLLRSLRRVSTRGSCRTDSITQSAGDSAPAARGTRILLPSNLKPMTKAYLFTPI